MNKILVLTFQCLFVTYLSVSQGSLKISPQLSNEAKAIENILYLDVLYLPSKDGHLRSHTLRFEVETEGNLISNKKLKELNSANTKNTYNVFVKAEDSHIIGLGSVDLNIPAYLGREILLGTVKIPVIGLETLTIKKLLSLNAALEVDGKFVVDEIQFDPLTIDIAQLIGDKAKNNKIEKNYLYPNPAQLDDRLIIQSTDPINTIDIYTSYGRLVRHIDNDFNNPQLRISTAGLMRGMYFMAINGGMILTLTME